GGDPVGTRHAQVHQHDVGRVLIDRGRDFRAVGGLADHLDAVRAVEHHGEPGPDEGVVVDEQHPDAPRGVVGHSGPAGSAGSAVPAAPASAGRATPARRPTPPPALIVWSIPPPASRTRSVSPIKPVPLPLMIGSAGPTGLASSTTSLPPGFPASSTR